MGSVSQDDLAANAIPFPFGLPIVRRAKLVNAALRARHRLLTTVLAVAVPVGLAVALISRPSPPTMPSLPPTDALPAAYATAVGPSGSVSLDDATLTLTLLRSVAPPRFALRIEPANGRGVSGPDVLAYWSAAPSTAALTHS